MVNAFLIALTCATKTGVHAGEGLKFERNMFYDVAHPCAFFNAQKKTSGLIFGTAVRIQRSHQNFKPIKETWNGIGGAMRHFLNVEQHHNELVTTNGP